jgi:2-polyprenyl-3-methyl-5-hydroxy-6-metoxy-1,4-benzoquinol methylase
MKNEAPHGPEMIMGMFQGAQASAIVAAGIKVGVFGALAAGACSADAVAERIKCPARSTRLLLEALSVLGLVAAEGATYKLAPAAADHLVPGKPMYMGDVADIFLADSMWTNMARLADAVRAGGSVAETHAETPEHPFWVQFAKSSAAFAIPAAATLDGLLQSHLAGKPKARVLDVACGSGIYGYTLAKHPNVELSSLDWPNVLEETRAWGKRLGIDTAKVKYLPGNLFEVDFAGPYDVVVLSHVFHHFDPPTCQGLVRKVAAALAPGGRVAVHDFMADEPGGKMFSITMLGWTRKGEAYGKKDYAAWFQEAGLGVPEVHASAGMPTTFLIGSKR